MAAAFVGAQMIAKGGLVPLRSHRTELCGFFAEVEREFYRDLYGYPTGRVTPLRSRYHDPDPPTAGELSEARAKISAMFAPFDLPSRT